MRLLLVVGLVLVSCTLEDVDLTNRHCPCSEGWTCDEARDLCVRDGGDGGRDAEADDAGEDAPTDAGFDVPGDIGGDDVGIDAGSDGAVDAFDGGTPPTGCGDFDDAIFCDGFEEGLDRWDAVLESSGAARWQTDPPIYRGIGALVGQTTAPSGRAAVRKDFPVRVSGMLFARAYVYLPSEPSIGTVSVLYLSESVAPAHGVSVQIAGDGRAHIYNGVVDRLAAGVRPEFPRDRWACVTLEVEIGDEGRVHAEVDGLVIGDETGIPTLPAAGISRLVTGLEYTSPTTSEARAFVDEVVLDDVPIRCDPEP